jgi:hypothetical protein
MALSAEELWWKVPALTHRGKITIPDPGVPGGRRVVVFQRTWAPLANVPLGPTGRMQVRSEPPRNDAKSPAQLVRRTRFRDAITAFRALSVEEKREWRKRGRSRNLPGYQAFLSHYMRQPFEPPEQQYRDGSALRDGSWTRGAGPVEP